MKGPVLMQLTRDQRITGHKDDPRNDDWEKDLAQDGKSTDDRIVGSPSITVSEKESQVSMKETQKACVTREDSRAISSIGGYTTSPPGTPCVFGVDDRDEGSHCIMDDEQYGSFGWCFTSQDKASFGSCSEGCPLYGHFGTLHKAIQSLRSDIRDVSVDVSDQKGGPAATTSSENSTSSAGSNTSAKNARSRNTSAAASIKTLPVTATGLDDWEKDYITDDQPDAKGSNLPHPTRDSDVFFPTFEWPGLKFEFAGSLWGVLPTLLFLLISNLVVLKIHADNTKFGILQTCGWRSFICCCCCGGFMTLWQPIDRVLVGSPHHVSRS
jgi:hypothetical protein